MIPNGWEQKPLHEVAKIQTGIAKGKKDLKDPIELPYLRVANVQDGHLDLEEVKKIAVSRREIGRYSLRRNDVLLTEGGDFDKLGRGTIWSAQIEPCLHQNHVFAVRTNPDILDPYFFSLQAGGDHGRSYFLSCAKRSTNLASINSSQLKEFPTILPPIIEQRRISKAIQCWDKAISTTESLIAAKQQCKQAMMQHLLTGKKRLPGFKKPWQACRLGDLFDERSEGGRTDLPLLSITRDQGIIPRDDVERKDTSSEDKSKYLRICPGDIGYNTMRMWQGVSALSSMEGIISPAYTVCVPHSNVSARFMAHLFKFDPMIRLFERHSQGMTSDTWSLKYPNFSEIKATVPELKEMDAIADILDLANREFEILVRRKAALEEQKKALMAVLLTGKKRLKA